MQRYTPSANMPVISSPAPWPGVIRLENMSDVEAELAAIFLQSLYSKPFIANFRYSTRLFFHQNNQPQSHTITFSHQLCFYERKARPAANQDSRYAYAVLEGEPLGKGSFSTVYLVKRTLKIDRKGKAVCKLKEPTSWRAIKIFDKSPDDKSSDKSFMHPAISSKNEYEILKLIDSARVKRNILSPDQTTASLLMAYIPGQDLLDCLVTHQNGTKPLSVLQRLELSRKLFATLAYVHGRGVIDRDVKPENIKVSFKSDGSVDCVTLFDFNLAKERGKTLDEKEDVGSPAYASPEAFANTLQDEKSDIYSLGRVVCCVWGLKIRFDHSYRGNIPGLRSYFASLNRFDFLFSDVADPVLSSGQRQRIHDLLFAIERRPQADRPDAVAAIQLFDDVIGEYKASMRELQIKALGLAPIVGSMRPDTSVYELPSAAIKLQDEPVACIQLPLIHCQQSSPLLFSPVAAAAPASVINNRSNNPGCVLF